MNTRLAVSALRPATHRASLRVAASRYYATARDQQGPSSAGPKRRAVTPFNDDGQVAWSDLSIAEKGSRAAQQTFNFGFIIVGVALTGGVGYLLWHEVFSTESKVTYFNRAVDRIRKDHRCLELLGDSNKIAAHGDETFNKWRRARPIAASERNDQQGNHHLIMHFFVEGPLNRGTAFLHLIKHAGHSEYEYKYFYIDIKGHQRIYFENADGSLQNGGAKKSSTLFGIKWS
ncbi:TIM21-domain-containing protein [Coniella lustricola]|uniref:Mitochondrial import inner membrane translocase subunit Tim21 n=1 Tax=Coniella lustricola TaxID=2025994 RepID=A0A2T3AKI4_9PEZI|nr:TIM21-domain-containing protein [Coniella lustricola]